MIRPPVGKITQIGDAGVTSHALNTNDDLYLSGRIEVDGYSYFDDLVYLNGGYIYQVGYGCTMRLRSIIEEITVLIGNSSANSVNNLAPLASIIEFVAVRVNQAPGGGPTHWNMGRTGGGNPDEYIAHQSVALGGRFNNIIQSDDTFLGPHYNQAADTFTIQTTDAGGVPTNVTIEDMKVRVMVIYKEVVNPTS